MMFMLVKWCISEGASLRVHGSESHVFRACGDSLICPFSKGMILPILRYDM